MGDVGEDTDRLPSVRAAQLLRHVLLGVLALGSLGVAAVLAMRPPVAPGTVPADATAAIDAEAKRLPVIIDSTAKSAHVQAATMAQGAQIRAGIMTDAATVKDLVTSEIQLPRNLDQTLELVQLRDAERSVLLRMPDGAAPVGVTHAMETRFEVNGKNDLALVIGAAIAPFDNSANITGELILSTPLDFAITREALSPIATRVALSGKGWTLPIFDGPGDSATEQHVALALDAGIPAVTLDVAPRITATVAAWANPVRLVALAAALGFAVALAISLYRNRAP